MPPDGSVCPANRWYVDGGCASGSGVTATLPPNATPQRAWQFRPAKGSLCGEPLVWDDFVVVEVVPDAKHRRLQILALADGHQIANREFQVTEALAPSLWGREVIVRVGNALKRVTFSAAGTFEQGTSRLTGSYGPPVRCGDQVFAVLDGALVALRAADLSQLWRSEEKGIVGRPAVYGDSLFAVGNSENGATILEVLRANGAPLHRERTGLPAPGKAARPYVGGGRLLLFLDATVPAQGKGTLDSMLFPLPLVDDVRPPGAASCFHFAGAPALDDRGFLGGTGTDVDPGLGFVIDTKRSLLLADGKTHPGLVGARVTRAGDAVWFDGVAVDADPERVGWPVRYRLDAPAKARAVPARDTLLFAGSQELVAYRAAAPAGSTSAVPDYAAPFVEQQQALLRKIVDESLAAKDWPLVDAVLERCRLAGVDEAVVKNAAQRRRSESAGKAPPNAAAAAALRVRLDRLDTDALAALWRTAAAKTGPADRPAYDELLRFALEHAPAMPEAVDAVRALLPTELRGQEPFAARQWLDFATVTASVPLAFMVADTKEIARNDADQMKLLELRDRWRKDLVALQSPRLVVYTPVTAPGSVARCLSLGELVCTTLESMFAEFPIRRQDPRRMRLCLFETQKEYLQYLPEGGSHLGASAGHYSSRDEVSRMFVPADDAAFARVLPVFAHELTHQWLEDRCPALGYEEMRTRRPGQRGHWVVEGFPSFLEYSEFDLRRRTCATDGSCNANLDLLANAPDGLLLPWSRVLEADDAAFAKLAAKVDERRRIQPALELGSYRTLSELNCYYLQAGALCHWLYVADGGSRRRALLEFVLAYYSGRRDDLDLAAKLGMSADAIGAAVVAHAKASLR